MCVMCTNTDCYYTSLTIIPHTTVITHTITVAISLDVPLVLEVLLDEPVLAGDLLHQLHYFAVRLPQQLGQVIVALLHHSHATSQHSDAVVPLL